MNEELIIGRKLGEDEESIVCIQGNFGNWDEEVFKETFSQIADMPSGLLL